MSKNSGVDIGFLFALGFAPIALGFCSVLTPISNARIENDKIENVMAEQGEITFVVQRCLIAPGKKSILWLGYVNDALTDIAENNTEIFTDVILQINLFKINDDVLAKIHEGSKIVVRGNAANIVSIDGYVLTGKDFGMGGYYNEEGRRNSVSSVVRRSNIEYSR